jgi:flavodoxin I
MKALVVYDSAFGNTEQIARAIAQGVGEGTEVVRAGSVQPGQLTGLDLLIVGSPTQKFRPLPPVSELLKAMSRGSLNGVRVAAFDTRMTQAKVDAVGILAFFVKIFGYAADPIAKRLVKAGGKLAAAPEGFYVEDTEGPLQAGELERATAWGRRVAAG